MTERAGCEIVTKTQDDQSGIIWWNALSKRERTRWSRAAGNTGRVKDAWEAFKRARQCIGCDGHECDDGCQYPGSEVHEPRTAAGSFD